MSFKKNKYTVLKQAISPELAEFVYKYFLNKREVAKFLFDNKYISPFTEYFGVWNDNQVPNTYGTIGIILIVIGVIMVNYLGRLNWYFFKISGSSWIPSSFIDNS